MTNKNKMQHTNDGRPEYYQAQREDVLRLLPKRYSKVLELGCGEGRFRTNLDQENEYWGIEPAEQAATVASGKLHRVLVGTYSEVFRQIPDNYFDLVICNDVIEHMSDHEQFFRTIKGKMKPEGRLVCSIPNVRYLLNIFDMLVRKDWKYREDGILDRTHLRFFTEKSLKRTITDCGFIIEEFTGLRYYHGESIQRKILAVAAEAVFGKDVRFLQFGVRLRMSDGHRQDPRGDLLPSDR